MVKIELDPRSHFCTYPSKVTLVTCLDEEGKSNIITLSWATFLSFDPPYFGISIAPSRYSHKLIKDTGEFVANFCDYKKARDILFCGRKSGRDVDKFEETSFTELPALKVKPPRIKECYAHIECKVVDEVIVGDHTLFVGEIVSITIDGEVLSEGKNTINLEKVNPALYLSSDTFCTADPKTAMKPKIK